MTIKNIFIIILLPLLFISCRKACTYAGLPSESCTSGNIKISNTTYYHANMGGNQTDSLIVINNDSGYKAIFSSYYDQHLPFGEIDFSQHTLLGVYVHTDMADGVSSQGFLCFNYKTKKLKYTVQYSLKDQCKGSGIMTIDFSGWLLCPKLPNTNIELEIEDVNPF